MGTRSNRLSEAVVLTSTHNLCFEQEYEKYQNFLSKKFPVLVVKFTIYLKRRVFVIHYHRRRKYYFEVVALSKIITKRPTKLVKRKLSPADEFPFCP